MSTICARCALRLQRAAQTETRHASQRAFSQTTTRRKHHGIPTFTETSTPELNDVLASMRSKHFTPAYLHASERRLIFGTKNRQTLADNPQTVTVGDEDIELQWLDRRNDIPNRTTLFHRAIDLMAAGTDSKAWSNLPSLLAGLKGAGAKVEEKMMGKVVRKAVGAGRIAIVVQCLQQGGHTGMTLQSEQILEHVIWGLHMTAQRDGEWSEEAVLKALKAANQLGLLLETEEHGGGRYLREHDPRRRAEVLGVFLELAAVHAYKFQGGKDVDGKVKIYAERLLGCIDGAAQPLSHAPVPTGPQYEMLHGIPIWHGLHLAEKILGKGLPQPQVAKKVRQDYEAGLTILAQAIEAQQPKAGSYGDQAVRAWRECIRD
ncbi:hypothetical protein LTR36_006942 [Oleoguttula mirabilis]|uniref:Uncharacterized protein n=1 Tax=Oleoguttula mirabilis TaxID=1507867 RepID=A0AAV9JB75_9PEZI|nr:hypothetical protein LTR36_006942 [Oleoguttula mirabilis]